MNTNESEVVTKYKGELTENSSIYDEGFPRISAQEILEEVKTPPKEPEQRFSVLKFVKNVPPPSASEAEKARRNPDYSSYMRTFSEKYGREAPAPKETDRVIKRLDSHFQVLQGHSREIEKRDCDLSLYRNKIQKDLGDVMNDLREAYNIITILVGDRTKLQDLFAIYSIQLKSLKEVSKNLEEDLNARDKTINRIKAQAEELQKNLESVKEQSQSAKKVADEKTVETNALKRQLTEQRIEFNRLIKVNDVQKDEIERLKKDTNRAKTALKAKIDELDKARTEIPILKEANSKFAVKNEELVSENEKLRSDFTRLKEETAPLFKSLKAVKAENSELRLANDKLIDKVKELEETLKAVKEEDLKSENEKVKRQLEDLTKQFTDAINESSKLKKKPQELETEYSAKIAELTDSCNTFKDSAQKLTAENERLKKDLNEIIEEKRKRNAERRRKKEEQLKKLAEEAERKMEENKKKLEAKKSTIEANDLLKNVMQAQETLKKYPEPNAEPQANEYFDEDIPQYQIPELPIDLNMLDMPATEFRSVVKQKGSSVMLKQQYFEVKEPSNGETKRAFTELKHRSTCPLPTFVPEEASSFELDQNCPYCWTSERKTPYSVIFPKSSIIRSVSKLEPPSEKEAIVGCAKQFLGKVKTDQRLKEIIDKLAPGVDLGCTLKRDEDLQELGSKLISLMKKREDESAAGMTTPKRLSQITEDEVENLLGKFVGNKSK